MPALYVITISVFYSGNCRLSKNSHFHSAVGYIFFCDIIFFAQFSFFLV